MRTLVFGTYDEAKHPRVAVLVEGLRLNGIEVVRCNAPLNLGTAERVAILRQPWRLPVLALELARCWLRLVRDSRRFRGAVRPDVVVVGYLGHFDVRLARLLFPRATIVLDHLVSAAGTAADRGERGGVKQWLLRRVDAQALGAADLVVVDTRESRDALPAGVRNRTVVVPVGATTAWFEAAERHRDRRPDAVPTAVFFGMFTPLQGTPTIASALAMLPEGTVRATLIGSGQDHDRARSALAGRSDVVWRDWVDGDELPDLAAGADICLGIFGDGAKAVSVVPTKVYQGAAAGCAVVTSDTPPQRRALPSGALLVPPGDPAALADALRALSADRARLERMRTEASSHARARFTASGVTTDLVNRLYAEAAGAAAPKEDHRATAC